MIHDMEKLKKVASSIETQQSLTAFNIKRKMLGRDHFRECISSEIIDGLPEIESQHHTFTFFVNPIVPYPTSMTQA